MEIFKAVMPQLSRPLVLFDARDPFSPRWLAAVRQAATTLKLQVVERQVANAADLERLFPAIKPGDVDGVFVASPDLRTKFRAVILDLAVKRQLPLAGNRKEWLENGALFSYNDDQRAIGRAAAARYVDRILKGAKPADLPVEELTQFELIINLKTAKSLGLTIPPSLLLRADELIQ